MQGTGSKISDEDNISGRRRLNAGIEYKSITMR